MKDDLADALIPVFWAREHIPVLQERLLKWQGSYSYDLVAERDPVQAGMDLVVARLRTPLDPLIIGDVGAIINSVRTGLDRSFGVGAASEPSGQRNRCNEGRCADEPGDERGNDQTISSRPPAGRRTGE
jgi:hypothetical protein